MFQNSRKLVWCASFAIFSLIRLPALAGSVDAGRVLYQDHCYACHVNKPVWGKTASQINKAIAKTREMLFLASVLTQTDISDIATYLQNPNTNDSDRLFEWGEHAFPNLLTPPASSQVWEGYYYRYYSATNIYVGTKDGRVYFYDANNPQAGIVDLGTIRHWLEQAGL